MNKFPVIYSTLFFSVAKWPSSELQNCTNAIATKMSSSPRLSGICLPFGHCPGPDPDLDSELESGMGLGERAVGWWVSHPLSVVSVAQHKFSLSLGPSVLQAKGETLLAGATSFAYGNSRTTHCPPFNSLAPPSPALPPPRPMAPWPLWGLPTWPKFEMACRSERAAAQRWWRRRRQPVRWKLNAACISKMDFNILHVWKGRWPLFPALCHGTQPVGWLLSFQCRHSSPLPSTPLRPAPGPLFVSLFLPRHLDFVWQWPWIYM